MTDIRNMPPEEELPNIADALANGQMGPVLKELLEDTQCNILKGHGLGFAVYVMLRFSKDPVHIKRILDWISGFGPTSAHRQYELFDKSDNGASVNGEEALRFLALTKAGYDVLGISPKDQPQNPTFQRPNPKYQRGMKYRLSTQGGSGDYGGGYTVYYPDSQDTLGRGLQPEYRGEIHAMAVFARDIALDHEYVAHRGWDRDLAGILDGPATIVSEEIGVARWGDDDGEVRPGPKPADGDWFPVEHFGYRDGIGNPRFFESRDDERRTPEGNEWIWRPYAPLSLVLTPENGSYLAFRKLEQDVRRFDDLISNLANDLYGGDLERARSMVIGRFPNGRPAIDPDLSPDANDFDYASDPEGRLCPFHAHIRRTNPRGDIARFGPRRDPRYSNDPGYSKDQERRWLIVRRGMPYGDRDSGPVGLLFVSCQADLANFELIQGSADNENFVRVGSYGAQGHPAGIDPIIGQKPAPVPQSWPNDSVQGTVYTPRRHLIHDVVTLRGGEYFYAPGLNELKNLKKKSALSI